MYRVNMRFYFSKEFKDDFGNKAGIEEVKISSYKGAARKPAFRLVCFAEYNNGFFDYCAAGLEPYWSGHWYAHFMNWKASVDPSRMVGCLIKLPKEDRDKVFLLLKRYKDGETEASGEFDKKI